MTKCLLSKGSYITITAGSSVYCPYDSDHLTNGRRKEKQL